MIGITKEGNAVEIALKGSMAGRGIVALLIVDPEELPQELINIKKRFHSPDDQYNLKRCLDTLHIQPCQLQGFHDARSSKPGKSYHLLKLATHRFSDGFQIDVRIKAFRPLVQTLLKLSLIHISEPTRPVCSSRMPSSA